MGREDDDEAQPRLIDRILAPEAHSMRAMNGLLLAGLAEFFCMAAFIFLATGIVTSGCHTGDVARQSGGTNTTLVTVAPGACFLGSTNLLNIAFGFGLSIFVLVYATANISGGHLNPAITISMLSTGKLSLLRAFVYVSAQLTGACLGSVLVKAIDPLGYKAALGAANRINAWANTGAALGVEIILTAIFVFVVHCAVDTRRASSAAHIPVLAPLSIGFALFLCHLVAVPIDGCSVNPARSFGVAAVVQDPTVWQQLWIFFVGPIIGGCSAGILYELGAPKGESHSSPKEDKHRKAPAEADAYNV